jgi:hypothetical protein
MMSHPSGLNEFVTDDLGECLVVFSGTLKASIVRTIRGDKSDEAFKREHRHREVGQVSMTTANHLLRNNFAA